MKFKIIFTLLALTLILTGCHSDRGKISSRSDEVDSDKQDTVIKAEPNAPTESLIFAFTGDIMLGTDYPDDSNGVYLPVDSGKQLFNETRNIFKCVDLACGNLEGVLGQGTTPKECNNPALCYIFRMPSFMKYRLVEAGFDYMNLANNHISDFMIEGIESTMRNLSDVGIAYGGIRRKAPYSIIERNGLKIGFTGFATNYNALSVNDYEELKTIIGELRGKCDIVVVSMHAGGEGKDFTNVPRRMEYFHAAPRGDVYKFAHTAIDAGADIVWGHGPHVMRGAELYKDRLILYSLGNFCTPYKVGLMGINGQSVIATVRVDKEGKFQEGELHSFIQTAGKGPSADPSYGAARQIRALSQQDFPESDLKISGDGVLSR